MKSTSYKIQIKGSINGNTVTPKSIAWIHGNDSCLATPCYKENDYFVIEMIPDCVGGNCIEGYLTFGSDCDNCEPVYFKKCFCTSSSDCNECEECNQYGVCQSICKDGEFCDENGCSECNDSIPCPCNKKCSNGKCVCPQNMFEKDGCCVECDSTTNLTKCEECVNGVIRQKECDGACDPLTGDCVGCLTGGDCSDRLDGKTCCKDKVCVCCEGTVWDPKSSTCVPQPCESDAECGPCKKCTPEGCKEIECPENHKCVDGECKYWPCISTSCNNGADCGPECGCLNGECTPCYLLDCNGECNSSLGCECTNGVTCEPVDNCDQYCDGLTPCIDTNCTCYNNNCVSCKNFPCTTTEGGCSSYVNCGCTDDGNCEGGACSDTLTITKRNDCDSLGSCKLQGTLKTKGCKCDPIEFRITNTNTVDCTKFSSGTQGNLFSFNVDMYKNNQPYKDYKTNSYFSDDELVAGSVKAIVTHKIASTSQIVNPSGVTPLATQSITDNKVPSIVIKEENIKRSIDGKATIVEIKIVTENIKVAKNNCTKYENKTIAEFVLDFSTAGTVIETCTKLNGDYKKEFKANTLDILSVRKPLFTWYKSPTGDFSGKYEFNESYSSKGWVFKEYVEIKNGEANSFLANYNTEKLVTNNHNYKLTVDCGCVNSVTEEKVLFCCTDGITAEITDCNQKIKVPSFKVCYANNSNWNLTKAKEPKESKTTYYLHLELQDGTKVKEQLVINGSTSQSFETTKEYYGNAIKSAYVVQSYSGGMLSEEECRKDFTINQPSLPTPVTSVNCNYDATQSAIYVTDTTNPKISKYSLELIGPNIPLTNNRYYSEYATFQTVVDGKANTSRALIPKGYLSNVSKFELIIYYANGCTTLINLPKCNGLLDVDTNPPNARSTVNCPNGGTGVVVELNTSFFDPNTNIDYTIQGGSIDQEKTAGTNTQFNNIPAGTYTVTATQGDLTATNTITILDSAVPTVSLSPASICVGQSSTLTINAVSGTVFSVVAPNGTLVGNNITTGSNNVALVQNLTQSGNYIVTLVSDPSKAYCTFSTTVNLEVGGQTLNPTIEVQPGNYCVGQPIPFRIVDGGKNGTYTISSNGSGTITSPLQASSSSYNGTFTPNSTTALLSIVASNDGCNVITATQVNLPSGNVTITQGPVITSATAVCQQNNLHTVNVIVNGTPTSVTIAGVAATFANNTWSRTNIQGLTEALVVVSSGSCSVEQTVQLQNCLCPTGEVYIVSGGDTCGQGTSSMTYNGTTLNIDNTWQYVWQNFIGGNWSDLGSLQTFALPTFPTLSVNTQVGINETRRLKVVNPTNGCIYYSNDEFVTAVNPPTGATITPSTAQVNVPVIFSTQQGYYSYLWGGGATGNTYQSNSVTFTTPGTFPVTCQVCNAAGCCETITNNVVVGGSTCNLTLTQPINYTDSCINQITVSGSGGSGTRTYQATSSLGYINVPAGTAVTPGTGTTFTIPLNVSAIPKAETDTITITVQDSSNPQCSATTFFTYERCGCCDTVSSVCLTTSSLPIGEYSNQQLSRDLGKFEEGTKLRINIGPGTCPDAIRIKAGTTTIFESGIISGTQFSLMPNTKCCRTDLILNGVPMNTIFLGDNTSGTPLTNTSFPVFNTSYLTIPTGFLATDQYNYPSCLSTTPPTCPATSIPCDEYCGQATIFGDWRLYLDLTVDATIANQSIIVENYGSIAADPANVNGCPSGNIGRSCALIVNCITVPA